MQLLKKAGKISYFFKRYLAKQNETQGAFTYMINTLPVTKCLKTLRKHRSFKRKARLNWIYTHRKLKKHPQERSRFLLRIGRIFRCAQWQKILVCADTGHFGMHRSRSFFYAQAQVNLVCAGASNLICASAGHFDTQKLIILIAYLSFAYYAGFMSDVHQIIGWWFVRLPFRDGNSSGPITKTFLLPY